MELVVGVDAGGTASHAVVATADGVVVGRGRAGPGNPLSAGPAAVSSVGAAVRQALQAANPRSVIGGVLGLAGSSACDDAFASALDEAWAAAGLRCPWRVVGDAVTAFAAGTSAPDGAVLIAGTGAVAAEIQDHQIVRVTDGLGWLLGDEGSGHWLGLSALRAAVRAWSSSFAAAVADAVGVTSPDRLIGWAQELHHAEIAALAPLVCDRARAGDPHATAITGEAVDRLIATLGKLGQAGPVVLAGSLLTHATPVRDGLLAVLDARGVSALISRDPAAAAAWLALPERSPAAHAALLRT
ncbi:N-acetylglucosamine kinase [Actinoplanes sp. OR16]|uniref:N-acetylglucosamine kinase n=1 Tax=Actinoplanes sp. OR16 TaxID=946334 RepID=UPI000F6FE5A2|nr:BadF/BadG/BcrA/BcrD ATPase family protein [Actinoplanes sp. OR16]BBH67673.1 N-acetylglucosamine kinase [Actinoplanes sp. OR16]